MIMKRTGVMILATSLIMNITAFAASQQRLTLNRTAISVMDCGAKGDGTADDTAAFQKALSQAKKEKKPVCVKGGKYCISQTLSLEGVSLIGDTNGAWPADGWNLPLLICTNPEVDSIHINNATLSGVAFEARHKSSDKTLFKPIISITGDNAHILNVKLASVSIGIRSVEANTKNLIIENVFMTDPNKLGVYVSGTKGTVMLKNIEMWPSTQSMSGSFAKSGAGIILSNNENIKMTDCFVWNAQNGILLEEDSGKGNTITMENCSVDYCSNGLVVKGNHKVDIVGGTYWAHFKSVSLESGKTDLTMRGMDLRSNGSVTAYIKSAGTVKMTGLIVRRTMDDRDVAAMLLGDADSITMEGCTVFALRTGNPAVEIGGPGELVMRGNTVSNIGKNVLPDGIASEYTVANNVYTAP